MNVVGYVVVEYNQASGWPSIPIAAELHDGRAIAEVDADVHRDTAAGNGRREKYAVCELVRLEEPS